mgnify:CR=1 FL=1|tara:strand:+ start:4429 stop:4902 length:474 start_codon:yes stop_codon:yes gene_type:complete
MNFVRSIKKCESWVACSYKADKETIGFEHYPDRRVLYQYVYYGSAKIGTPFSSQYRLINQKGCLIDVKEFYMKNIIYDFIEDTSMWGFNTLNDGEDWNGVLINETFIAKRQSVLVCLDGSPVVNNIMLSRYDYDKLTEGKKYTILPDSGVLALFTKK